MDFKVKYNQYLEIIESKIEECLKVPDLPQREVFEAMRYAVTGGGKRIRPVLTLAVAELCCADTEDAVRLALSVECVHNYSLIHDDLPCMDDDDLRRGRATCHKVYGESAALLAGDGLLNMAFEILSGEGFSSMSACDRLRATRILSSASGAYGMIGGQMIDLKNENRTDVSLDELIYMHGGKTGALIKAAAVCGAICAGIDDDDERISAIETYASKLGLAFQIKDDILDVIGDEGLLGKPVGSDEKSGKNTFVTLLGREEADEHLRCLTSEAKQALSIFGDRAGFLVELADYLLERSY